jgi:hypothetical protein
LIYFLLLGGSNPFYHNTTGKFEVEETEDEQEEGSMKINWQEMITPRNVTELKIKLTTE